MKYDIGIIAAMDAELEGLADLLENPEEREILGIRFRFGVISGKRVVMAKCGVGKVFAATCASAMIMSFSPSLLVNTGVGGGLSRGIKVLDTVVAIDLCQHDMDTSPIGDPVGLISGINKVYFEADERATAIVIAAAERLGLACRKGRIASGDQFVAASAQKDRIVSLFSADVCEMEGAAIAQVAYVSGTPFAVIRAISDGADEGSSMDYMKFLPQAARNSLALVTALIAEY